ncbi:hypothetical protein Tlet_0985 [Pseudothermotoga lettingae TMO]|jgi:prepilin-type N-terminal cleavage/methylation domain-containing protein|uniref:Prepilin-type N-terminal cleavage/methylation domain-containing protein n=1 Tax=Pseudothermotoga lettingae (strain ATCC BAA-301 / DSM 14385 / NBRC 107922 / TMO) TaxID=416591 RepID=A8F5W7_PSELT|nr:hypothetical protein Tlet_0985 [Pseudothermotoga lettingae TMO]KUK20157.1 MAG: Uncharacterized protein XD56_1927 [Pseudothermotoga lettingae]MDI3495554.1 hypothetical protein [Pseudothermotoga sp.]MDK2883801.1 hypothetical protein [Pseudothermotoga sp.]HBJ81500.1 prepilin-type cleavage/methylation domain-containing protein [Pseudothermotoga sp.]
MKAQEVRYLKKGFSLFELLIVLAVFSVFLIVLSIVLNDYLKKAEQNIEVLDALKRLTEASNKVTQYLLRASGDAISVKIASSTEITFDIIIAGEKINAKLQVADENTVLYYENNLSETIKVENVEIRFEKADPSSEIDLPVKLTAKTRNPFNKDSNLVIESTIYPPGVR